jgi:acetyl-CoA carboxylase carboxyl transferase subunit alpha
VAYEAELDFERPLVELERKIEELRAVGEKGGVNIKKELSSLEARSEELKKTIYAALTPWQRYKVARHPKRPFSLDYIGQLFTDFTELHGDRAFGDDPALVAGFARFNGTPVLVMGQQKGRDVKENLIRNFGMMNPEGYRKAIRLMKLAEKFARPVITFIDTAGAYPGIGAEERGQGEAIARNLAEMSTLKVPVIAVIIGEGGSGGALGIGLADRVAILEYSVYSIISPEGCAAILWRDAKNAPDAAKALKMTANDLLEFGIVDEIIPEPLGGAHRDPAAAAESVKAVIARSLADLEKVPLETLLETRFKKYLAMGRFVEVPIETV